MEKSELLEHAKPYYDENQLIQLERAIDFAITAHLGQKRASGDPYITHPLAVADTLITWGMDIDSVLSGVLHDTVEDLSLIHISEPTRRTPISYAVFCLKKKKKK